MTDKKAAETQRLKAGLEQAKRKKEYQAKQRCQTPAETADQPKFDETKDRK